MNLLEEVYHFFFGSLAFRGYLNVYITINYYINEKINGWNESSK